MTHRGIDRTPPLAGLARATLLVAALGTVLPATAPAQIARRSSGPTRAPAGTPRDVAPRTGAAYAGLWEGAVTEMRNGPGAGRPLRMRFDATANGAAYTGATLLPNDGREPHLNTAVAGGALRWEQTNIDGGRWHYSARLVGADSMVGTLTLRSRHWPTPPAGTFVLVRRAAPAAAP